MKCVLQSWLLLEESKAPQHYDLQLKHTGPGQKIDAKTNISINKNLPIIEVHVQFGPGVKKL
jgi:hypothetical protein